MNRPSFIGLIPVGTLVTGREPIAWRNAERGDDSGRPVIEPVGSLALRSGAIRIGRTLADVLFERTYREPRIGGPLRRWVSDLYGKPRGWLMRELPTWPAPVRKRWKRQFEWGAEFEWLRYAPSATPSHPTIASGISVRHRVRDARESPE